MIVTTDPGWPTNSGDAWAARSFLNWETTHTFWETPTRWVYHPSNYAEFPLTDRQIDEGSARQLLNQEEAQRQRDYQFFLGSNSAPKSYSPFPTGEDHLKLEATLRAKQEAKASALRKQVEDYEAWLNSNDE